MIVVLVFWYLVHCCFQFSRSFLDFDSFPVSITCRGMEVGNVVYALSSVLRDIVDIFQFEDEKEIMELLILLLTMKPIRHILYHSLTWLSLVDPVVLEFYHFFVYESSLIQLPLLFYQLLA